MHASGICREHGPASCTPTGSLPSTISKKLHFRPDRRTLTGSLPSTISKKLHLPAASGVAPPSVDDLNPMAAAMSRQLYTPSAQLPVWNWPRQPVKGVEERSRVGGQAEKMTACVELVAAACIGGEKHSRVGGRGREGKSSSLQKGRGHLHATPCGGGEGNRHRAATM